VITASDSYKAALTASHVAVTKATVLNPQPDRSYADGDTFFVASGGFTIDGTRNIWRTGNLVLAPESPFLIDPLDQIDGATRLRIDRGITIMGFTEFVTIATLQVQQASRSLTQGTLNVEVSDLGSLVQDYGAVEFVPQEDTTVVGAIRQLVEEAMWDDPVWIIDPAIDDTEVLPLGLKFDRDRWSAINELSKAVGGIVYADHNGHWNLRRTPDPATMTSVMAVVEGDQGILVNRQFERGRRETFNGVKVLWEHEEDSGVAWAVDSDPASPTYWDGPFGRKTAPEQRLDTINTQEQAQDAADALLSRFKGKAASVSFQSVHNPLVEPFDVITVSGNTRTAEAHVLDQINYSLTAGDMSAKTRQVA
jgi:hypothetical protein